MPEETLASQPKSQSRHTVFQRTNKVSHGENVPVLTKVRAGRWLHIQHLLLDHATNKLGEQTETEGVHTERKCKARQGISGIKQYDFTLMDSSSDRVENHAGTCTNGSIRDDVDTDSAARSVDIWCDSVETVLSCESVTAQTLSSEHPSSSGDNNLGPQTVFDREGGTVLFFIHGVGGSSSLWYYQMQYFQRQGFEIVAPDLFGHGFSEAPKKESLYSFYELAEDCLAVFDKFCKRRNILIGHSYGSSFCTVIARERERKVTKMILISGGGPVALIPPLCHAFCLPTCVLSCLRPLLTGAFVRQAFHKPIENVPSGDYSAFNVPSHVLRGTMQGQYWPDGDQDYHADINVSVLLIYGLRDEFVSLEQTEWMHETIFASTLETVDAGHMVMLECPDEVNDLVHRFILRDMVIRPRTGADKAVPTPNTALRKTMPHLMPGGLL